MWGLGNIAGDKIEFRDYLIEKGITDKLNQLLAPVASEQTAFVRNTSWALTNLCRQRPVPSLDKILCCVGTLCEVLRGNSGNPDVVMDVI